MIRAPRSDVIGGWFGGNPTERGSAPMSGIRRGRCLADQGSEQSVADGWVAERRSLLGRDPDRDEVLDRPAVRRQDAERSVACAREVHRELDDPLEHRVERELRGEDHPGLDQAAIPIAGGPLGHGPSVAEVACLTGSRDPGSRQVPTDTGSFGP